MSTELTPKHASLKKNEGFVYKKLLDKRKRIKAKFKIHDFVRVADLKRIFWKGDTTNWSYNLYKNTEKVRYTVASFRADNLADRYNEHYRKRLNYPWKKMIVLWKL